MPAYTTGLDIWSPNPPNIHDDRVLTFQIDTSPSVFSTMSDPVVRITPTPPPLDKGYNSSVRRPSYSMTPRTITDDPAFSTDPRLNPHFVPDHGRPFRRPLHSVGLDSRQSTGSTPSRSSGSTSTPPRTPPAASPSPVTNDSLSQKTDVATPARQKQSPPPQVSPPSDSRPSELSTPEEEKSRKKSGPLRSRDLDKIDELDESDPFGTRYHHYGPYQSANDALAGRVNRSDTTSRGLSKHMRALQLVPHQPPMPIGKSINLVPGQIFPKMPYQPQPPSDYISPPPTSAPLIPDLYPYDIPSAQDFSPEQYPNVEGSRMSAIAPASASHYQAHTLPIPRHGDANSPNMSTSFSPKKRHSLPVLPPPASPYQSSGSPSVRHPTSLPSSMYVTENIPHNISRPKHYQGSAPGIRRVPSFDTRMPVPPPPDISLPPAPGRLTAPTKPAPLHLPKKLVMPSPLQQQQQVSPQVANHSTMNTKHERDTSVVRQGQDQGVSHGHKKQRPQLMPRAPMIPDVKDNRQLLRRKTTTRVNGVVNEITYSTSPEDPTKTRGRERESRQKEKPAKVKTEGGLFRGSDTFGSKLVRKLTKMK